MNDYMWINGVRCEVVEMADGEGNMIPGLQTFTPLVPFGNHDIEVRETKNKKQIAVYGDATEAYGQAGSKLDSLKLPDGSSMKGFLLKHTLFIYLNESETKTVTKAAPDMPELFAAQGASSKNKANGKGAEVIRGNGK